MITTYTNSEQRSIALAEQVGADGGDDGAQLVDALGRHWARRDPDRSPEAKRAGSESLEPEAASLWLTK